jgi:mannitol-1-phosphate/altronate dehydrogenase
MNSKYFEKFIKDLLTEDELNQTEGNLLNESSEKKISKKQPKVLEENYARKLIRRYSEDYLNSVRYK